MIFTLSELEMRGKQCDSLLNCSVLLLLLFVFLFRLLTYCFECFRNVFVCLLTFLPSFVTVVQAYNRNYLLILPNTFLPHIYTTFLSISAESNESSFALER